MSNATRWALCILTTVAGLAFWAAIGIPLWEECRDAGHSALYCARMVVR